MRRAPLVRTALGLLLLASTACIAFGDEDLATLEPGAAPLQPTYEEHIEPFLSRYCVSCHSPDAPGTRRVGPYFDSAAVDDIDDWCDAFEQVESQEMPPGAMERPSGVERLTFRRWVEGVFASDPGDCDDVSGDDDDDDDDD